MPLLFALLFECPPLKVYKMNELQSTSSKLKLILILSVYLASLAWGIGQVLLPNLGGLYLLCVIVIAGGSAWWVVLDARDRGKPILHILQLFIFFFWPIAVPFYLIGSRGLRGVGLSVAHAVGLTLILCIGFYSTVLSIYGFDAFRVQP